MGMPATTQWTVEMVRALPDDGKRYEVIDGELFVTPAPSTPHQRAVRELLVRLHEYLRTDTTMEVLPSPADITYGKRVLVQPDVFVAPLPPGRKPSTWKGVRPLLAIEILSPSTARADRQAKRRLYQREGVSEYWIVDVDARLVDRWRPNDERSESLTDRIEWQPDPAQPPLVIELAEFFREVTGE